MSGEILGIEELIAVIESLPRRVAGYDGSCEVVIVRDDLVSALKNLLVMRRASEPDTEDLLYALRTGDLSRLQEKPQ